MEKIISKGEIFPKFDIKYLMNQTLWLTREKIQSLINNKKFLMQ